MPDAYLFTCLRLSVVVDDNAMSHGNQRFVRALMTAKSHKRVAYSSAFRAHQNGVGFVRCRRESCMPPPRSLNSCAESVVLEVANPIMRCLPPLISVVSIRLEVRRVLVNFFFDCFMLSLNRNLGLQMHLSPSFNCP